MPDCSRAQGVSRARQSVLVAHSAIVTWEPPPMAQLCRDWKKMLCHDTGALGLSKSYHDREISIATINASAACASLSCAHKASCHGHKVMSCAHLGRCHRTPWPCHARLGFLSQHRNMSRHGTKNLCCDKSSI